MNGMQHNLIGQKGNCRRLFFLNSGLEGSDGTRSDIQLQIIRMLSALRTLYHPFLCVQSFPIIQLTTIKDFYIYVKTIKLQKTA